MQLSAIRWAFMLLGLTALPLSTVPAFPISVELAKKCRLMAVKAYPPQLAGTKGGTAAAERQYFQDCVKNDGIMPEIADQPERRPPPPKQ